MGLMAQFWQGNPVMVDYVPSGAVSSGDVVVVNDLPAVCHRPIDASALGSLAVGGGVYLVTADTSYPPGTRVYWDPTTSEVTGGGSSKALPFGYVVGGATPRLDDAAGTALAVFHSPLPSGTIVYNLGAGASDTLTNLTAETAFATAVTIPAASLVAGDVIRVRAAIEVTGQNSTNTHTFKVKISTASGVFTQIVTTGAVNAPSGDLALIDLDVLFTAVGASGSCYALGFQGFGVPGTATLSPCLLTTTAINTAIAVTIEVTCTQSAQSTSNIAQLLELTATKLRK
jgi:predicted RecA/RadA family phage recombinase